MEILMVGGRTCCLDMPLLITYVYPLIGASLSLRLEYTIHS